MVVPLKRQGRPLPAEAHHSRRTCGQSSISRGATGFPQPGASWVLTGLRVAAPGRDVACHSARASADVLVQPPRDPGRRQGGSVRRSRMEEGGRAPGARPQRHPPSVHVFVSNIFIFLAITIRGGPPTFFSDLLVWNLCKGYLISFCIKPFYWKSLPKQF